MGPDPRRGHPAVDPGAEADLVPGGRRRVLAQDVVADGGAHRDTADAVVAGIGSGAHVEVDRVGALDVQLRVGTPGHPQVREVAAGLHVVRRHPAGDGGAVADLPPGGRGGVPAQDLVLHGGTALDEADPVVGPVGPGAHVEAERGRGLEAQPRGGVPGRLEAGEVAVGLHMGRGHPTGDGGAEADFVPAGRVRIPAQDVVAVGGAGHDDSRRIVGGAGAGMHVEVARAGALEAQLRHPGHGQAGQAAVGLHVGRRHPADDGGAEADLVPAGRGRILAQNVVAVGGAGHDDSRRVVFAAGPGTHVEAVRGGRQAQLRDPGRGQAVEFTVGLDALCGHPAGDGGVVADFVPAGDGRILAQDVVAGGGAGGDEADLRVAEAGPGMHGQAGRGGRVEAQLRHPGHPEAVEVAVGLDVAGVDPADGVAEADLVPAGRVRILAQNVVAVGGAGGDEADLGVDLAGAGAHVEAVRGAGREAQLRGRVPGHGQAVEVAVRLHVGFGHPAADALAVADFVPAGRVRILAQNVVAGGVEGQREQDAVPFAGARAQVEAGRGRARKTQSGPVVGRRRRGQRQVAPVPVQLHAGRLHPAADAAAEADPVPGGRGRILRQHRVACGAVRNRGLHGAGRGRRVPHGAALGGGGQAGLGRRRQVEAAVGLHGVVLLDPAVDGAVVAHLVPAGRGRILAQDVVAVGGAGGDEAGLGVGGAGARTDGQAVGGGGLEAQLRHPGHPEAGKVAVELDVIAVHPAVEAAAEADLVPGRGGRILAQNVVLRGRAARDRGHLAVGRAGTRTHPQAVRGAGLEAQLRHRGHPEAAEVAVRPDPVLVHPAVDGRAEADLVPGGRGRVPAQDVVAVGGAAGDEADLAVGCAGPRAHREVGGGRGLEAQLRDGRHPQAGEAAVGPHVAPVHPAVDGGAEADLVPGRGGRVPAQDVVAVGGAAGDEADPGVAGAGTGAHVEAERGRGPQAQLRGGVPGRGQAGEAAVGLDPVAAHPAGHGSGVADLPPARIRRVAPPQGVPARVGGPKRGQDGSGGRGGVAHRDGRSAPQPSAQPRPDLPQAARVVGRHLVGQHPAPAPVRELQLVPQGRHLGAPRDGRNTLEGIDEGIGIPGLLVRVGVRRHHLVGLGLRMRRGVRGNLRFDRVGIAGKGAVIWLRIASRECCHDIGSHPACGIGFPGFNVLGGRVMVPNLVPEVVLRGEVTGQVHNGHPTIDDRRGVGNIVDSP